MKKVNDSMNSPLRFISDDGRVFGQFYNSWDKTFHLAEYVPYETLPDRYVCGKTGNFASSRSEHDRKTCPECFSIVGYDPKIKVTRIAKRWHARLLHSETNEVLDEMACEKRIDIGWICREMLRWYDKLGGQSEFASAARHRQSGAPKGKVWYLGKLIDKTQVMERTKL